VTGGEDSGEDSGEEEGEDRRAEEEDDDDEVTAGSPVRRTHQMPVMALTIPNHQVDERAPSPDSVIVLSMQDNVGPSEEEEADFAKELAKMVTDSSAESRKVDKKTALALWDSTVLPHGARKKHVDETDDNDTSAANGLDVMNFTVITKRGNRQQVRG
jgi:regulator of nonsense transcripts 2